MPSLGVIKFVNYKQTAKDLVINFTPINKSMIDCAESLIKFGFIKKQSTSNKIVKKTIKILFISAAIGCVAYFGNNMVNK